MTSQQTKINMLITSQKLVPRTQRMYVTNLRNQCIIKQPSVCPFWLVARLLAHRCTLIEANALPLSQTANVTYVIIVTDCARDMRVGWMLQEIPMIDDTVDREFCVRFGKFQRRTRIWCSLLCQRFHVHVRSPSQSLTSNTAAQSHESGCIISYRPIPFLPRDAYA